MKLPFASVTESPRLVLLPAGDFESCTALCVQPETFNFVAAAMDLSDKNLAREDSD